jgi:hypothetical protein
MVFASLSREDVFQCMTICKSWLSPAYYSYYSEIPLTDENTQMLQVIPLDNDVGQWLDVCCGLVKKLNI